MLALAVLTLAAVSFLPAAAQAAEDRQVVVAPGESLHVIEEGTGPAVVSCPRFSARRMATER